MLTQNEIQAFINEDRASQKKKMALKGLRYYEADHDILKYRLYYYNADGILQEDKTRSNIKISHPFFTELVDQQVQYMMSGERLFRTDKPELQKELDIYFDDDFYSEVYDLLTGAVSKGFEYMYAYKNAEDRISFQTADSMGVIEVRGKDTDDGCDYVIYWYIDRIDKGKKEIKRIQVWDSEQTTFYVQSGSEPPELDNSVEINPRPHTIYSQGEEKYYENFGFIPFFRLDNNKKQFSGLKPIKTLIDDYDLMACSLSNNLQDFTDAIYVVSGFQGSNLDELITNIKTKKTIGVADGGGIDIKTVDIPHEARKVKLELDEKNIYRFGMGFNSAQVGDGNITNIVIKSRYALLDLKCNKLEIRLKRFLREILKVVLDEINQKQGTDYRLSDVKLEFDREIMTNAKDNAEIDKIQAETQQLRINTILNAAVRLDDETVVQDICDILDIDYEEIKGRIPKSAEKEITGAEELLRQAGDEDE